MLIFFFVRGVIVTFRPDTLTEAQQVISDFRKELVTEKKLNNEVLSFAQNFVYEYLTYTAGEEKDYKERLKQYITTTSNVSDTEIYKGAQKAVYVQAYRMDQLDNILTYMCWRKCSMSITGNRKLHRRAQKPE